MKIGLWAEIRRLAEIEKLSRRAIAPTAMLAIPRNRGARAGSVPRASGRAARVAWTRTRPGSTHCWPNIRISRRCASMKKLLAAPMATPAA